MSEDRPKQRSEADAELEREIRDERKFALTEAIGRMAGPGALKGASPIDRGKRAAADIQEYICRQTADSAGALSGVVVRQVAESELLLMDLDAPLALLAN